MTIKQKKKRDCKCSGHRRNRPKIGWGPCYGTFLRPAVAERIKGKKICKIIEMIVGSGHDPDDFDF